MRKKNLLFTLYCVVVVAVIGISLAFIHNYHNPNVAASIQKKYKWMEDVQIIHTDWYGDKGITFFVASGFADNRAEFCKGYVDKNIFGSNTSWEDCVPFTNKSKEGTYGTGLFFGKPIVSGFTLATTNVKFKNEKVKSYTYNNLKAWYVFSFPAEPTFDFKK